MKRSQAQWLTYPDPALLLLDHIHVTLTPELPTQMHKGMLQGLWGLLLWSDLKVGLQEMCVCFDLKGDGDTSVSVG